MITTETIRHFHCDMCDVEFHPTADCDGTRIFYDKIKINDKIRDNYILFAVMGGNQERNLCPDCQRKALEMALQTLDKTYGEDAVEKAMEKLKQKLKECNPDVSEYFLHSTEPGSCIWDQIVVTHQHMDAIRCALPNIRRTSLKDEIDAIVFYYKCSLQEKEQMQKEEGK